MKTVGALPGLFLLMWAIFGSDTFGNEQEDLTVSLDVISPYVVAGKDARFRVTVHSAFGAGLNAAMLDRSCFRIFLENGKELKPQREGLARQTLKLGTNAAISRTVDLCAVLKGKNNQSIEVMWEFNGLQSRKVTMSMYEWDLKDIQAVISTDKGEMVVEFYPDKAPTTVKNFVDLSLKGFYNDLKFHRVVKGFMIQGGCPQGDGTGDPGYTIKGEFSDISHERGVISMARSQDPDSAGCQFFIMHGDNSGLDGSYAAFGLLVSGLDTLDLIAGVETTAQRFSQENSKPVVAPRIKEIIIRPKPE